jgi:hypothetical protein
MACFVLYISNKLEDLDRGTSKYLTHDAVCILDQQIADGNC